MKNALPIILALALLAVSCSTTKVLGEGEYRLSKNELQVNNPNEFNANSLRPYIKQEAKGGFLFGWNPFMSIYNWSASNPDSPFGKFCRKIGSAPTIYNPDMVEASAENIRHHLDYLGWYGSKVETDVKVKRRQVTVGYNIALGKRYRIDSLFFSLPERGEFARDFMADTSALTIHIGDWLSEEALEEESERGSASFRNKGYYGFTKHHYSFIADTISQPGRTILEMHVGEQSRNENTADPAPLSKFYYNKVSIERPVSLNIKESILRELNTIHPGGQYSEEEVNNSYRRLSSLRFFSSVGVGMTQVDTNKVDCEITLSQSPLQGFKVNLEASTNSSGLMGVSPQLSFYHKNLFHGGEWLNLSFMGNFQFKFNDPTRSDEFGVSAGLSLPRFLGLPYSFFKGPSIPRTEINLAYNYQNRPEYTRNTFSTSFGYSGVLKERITYQFYTLQINAVRLFNMDPAFNESLEKNPFIKYAYQDHFDAGSGGNIYLQSRSASNPQASFNYLRLSLDLSGNLLSLADGLLRHNEDGAGLIFGSPYTQYVRGEISTGRTWKFGPDHRQAFATRILAGAGYAYGNSSALPFEKQFYSGGANSMRGWQSRALGPGLSEPNSLFIIPSQTGDMKLEANMEYRFGLFWKIAGALFVDAGNVWMLQPDAVLDNFAESIAADWGTGVRVDMDFIVLRIDMGMRLHDPARAAGERWLKPSQWLHRNGYAIHFGVGYPF